MLRTRIHPAIVIAIVLVAALSTAAQERRERIMVPGGDGAGNVFFEQAHEGVDIAIDKAMTGFVVSEFGFGGQAVKGAPYSADAVSEATQTLGDGNRIVRSNRSTLYRDGQGRTRREETLGASGPFAGGRQPELRIFLNDPSAGVNYTLDPGTRTARRLVQSHFTEGRLVMAPGNAADKEARARIEIQQAPATGGAGAIISGGERVAIETKIRAAAGRSPIEGPVHTWSFNKTESTFPTSTFKNESLGKRLIDGIEADGTRTTVTIPAGEIGNERAIEIVSERWYSPELQVVLSLRHSDPRFGENNYTLTNIRRGEPAASLFELPSDYKVEDSFMRIQRKPE